MKYFVLFALATVVAALPDGGDKSKHRPFRPAVFVRPLHRVDQGETYQLKFGVGGLQPLVKSAVSVWKIVKGEEGPEFKETDFEIETKALTAEEIKEWMEKHKEEWKDDKEGDDSRPKPRSRSDDKDNVQKPPPKRRFKHALVGKVTISSASCDDQGAYLIRYGKEPRDGKKDRDEDKDGDDKKRPRPRPCGKFVLLVNGCKKPDPRED